jgi:hypothetical protein
LDKLEKYQNSETSFTSDIVRLDNYEFTPDENISVSLENNETMYLIVNHGHLVMMDYRKEKIYCPAKNALLGFGKKPKLFFNNKNSYTVTILELSRRFSKQVNKKLYKLVDEEHRTVFKNTRYAFTFSVNIKILDLLSEMAGYNSKDNALFQLDIESAFLRILSDILQIIFFENYRIVNNMATGYTKYFLVLKQVLEGALTLEDALNKYQMERSHFLDLLSKLNPRLSFERLVPGHKSKKKK